MIRDITIGQYYPADSIIHKLDPRVKLAGTIIYIISLFLFRNIFVYLFITLCLAMVIRISKVPFSFMMKGLKAIILLLMITVILNLFLTPGIPIVKFWIFRITEEGIYVAFFMAIRLVYLIIGSSIMTLTTTPNHLTDGLEKCMSPLKAIRLPVHEIAMMMSIALRFIPILLEETDKIMKAQIARGADFESGNILRRAKSMIPILVPLFISAFRRAGDLALAMEARCYRGGDGRTKMKPLVYKSRDTKCYIVLVLYVVLTIVIGKFLKLGAV